MFYHSSRNWIINAYLTIVCSYIIMFYKVSIILASISNLKEVIKILDKVLFKEHLLTESLYNHGDIIICFFIIMFYKVSIILE